LLREGGECVVDVVSIVISVCCYRHEASFSQVGPSFAAFVLPVWPLRKQGEGETLVQAASLGWRRARMEVGGGEEILSGVLLTLLPI